MRARPRAPVDVSNPLTDTAGRIQVNHCRMPDCDNYGVEARTTPVPDKHTLQPSPGICGSGRIRANILISNRSVPCWMSGLLTEYYI